MHAGLAWAQGWADAEAKLGARSEPGEQAGITHLAVMTEALCRTKLGPRKMYSN